ncbi:MAG: cobyrinate a,c-diamide synthase, partial [Actinomycetota bacterium]
MAPGLIIAAPASGSGKTSATLGLLRALVRRGVRVASAKVGPDYIDPAFHAGASGRDCFNLDSWAMRAPTLAGLAAGLAADAELVVAEGVMGLFDGAPVDAAEPDGSTADLARRTGWPVVLVVDARGMAASAAAVIAGFANHQDGVAVAGVIFNRVSGERHAAAIAAACARTLPHVQVLGFLPRADELTIPGRHLGLVQACENPALEAFLDGAAQVVARHVDLDGLLALARPGRLDAPLPGPLLPPLGNRIAVARDEAFAFAYQAALQAWRRAGAELVAFSPLAGEGPDASCDAVYLPGGYPELHAGRLAAG